MKGCEVTTGTPPSQAFWLSSFPALRSTWIVKLPYAKGARLVGCDIGNLPSKETVDINPRHTSCWRQPYLSKTTTI